MLEVLGLDLVFGPHACRLIRRGTWSEGYHDPYRPVGPGLRLASSIARCAQTFTNSVLESPPPGESASHCRSSHPTVAPSIPVEFAALSNGATSENDWPACPLTRPGASVVPWRADYVGAPVPVTDRRDLWLV